MTRYSEDIKSTLALIKDSGMLVRWQQMKPTPGEDPANPGPGTAVLFPVYMVFLPNEQIRLLSTLTLMKGTDVATGALYGLMGQVEGFEPALTDRVLGTPYGDLNVSDQNGINKLAPNGEIILYTVRFAL